MIFSRTEKRESSLCPAARCEPGAHLVGVVQPSGRVAFLPPGGRVDEEFSRLASAPQSSVRFRYASRCVESGCAHWQGERCAALDEVRAHLAPFAQTTAPSCSIRPQCRWHQQAGDAACAVCPLVINEMMVLDEPEPEPDQKAGMMPAGSLALSSCSTS